MLNVDVRVLAHVSPDGTNAQEARVAIYAELYKDVVRVENAPTVTRFFLFTDCCFALLRAVLLKLPSCIFSVTAANPQRRNKTRLSSFKLFYESESDQRDLRLVCLCLRLTKVANVICGQKATAENAKEPTIVRLG